MNMWNIVFVFMLNIIWSLNGEDLYPSYSLTRDPQKVIEWSENRALNYITTVRLFDYDHHIFQYRRYPCQYFYTDEIQLNSHNGTFNQCLHNTTTNDYEYNLQIHLDSRHVEPFIFRNIAIQCNYTKCSLSLLNITYIYIGWNLRGRENNPDCSFDINHPYHIHRTPYTISEWITLRCKSLSACNQSKLNIEQSFSTYIQLIYGSSYELEVPYCSLEKNLNYIVQSKLDETNQILQQLLDVMKNHFTEDDEQESKEKKVD